MEDIIFAIEQFKKYVQASHCEKDGSRITNEKVSAFIANMDDLVFCEVLSCGNQIKDLQSLNP